MLFTGENVECSTKWAGQGEMVRGENEFASMKIARIENNGQYRGRQGQKERSGKEKG